MQRTNGHQESHTDTDTQTDANERFTPATVVGLCKAGVTDEQHVAGNMLLVAGNMLPVSRQHVSLCIQQQTGNKLATILLLPGNMLLGNMLPWCKRGLRVDCLQTR